MARHRAGVLTEVAPAVVESMAVEQEAKEEEE